MNKPLIVVFLISFFCFAGASPVHGEDVGSGDSSAGTITSIEVDGLHRIDRSEFDYIIDFGTGDAPDREKIATGIRRLFKKGIFLDIRAYLEPGDGGVALKYVVHEIPVVRDIIIDGNGYVSGRKIREVLIFKEDGDYMEDRHDEAVTRLEEFYERRGFPDADIRIETAAAGGPSSVNIYVNISEGKPLVVKSIEVPDDVKYYMTMSPGDILDRYRLEKIMEKMRNHYREDDYIHPEVGPYEFSDGRLVIPADRGPRLEVQFKYNTVIGSKRLRKELTITESEYISDEMVAEAATQIKDLFVSEGYYYAQAAGGIEREKDVIRITFVIYEGPKVMLGNIHFSGNSIPSDVVRRVIPLRENAPYNHNLLENSRDLLKSFYNALGYINMKVVRVTREFSNSGKLLDIEFVIEEGIQVTISSIHIEGNNSVDARRIRRALRIERGSPYNVIDIGDARYRLISLYNRMGYIDAHADVRSEISGGDASLNFRIHEGKRAIIGKIILRGNRQTKAKIIKREFLIGEGAPYNIEEIKKTRQRLYKLGIFRDVEISPIESIQRGEDVHVRDVLVSVKERKAGSVEFSVGYGDYEEVRGAVDIRYRNLGGYHRQIGFRSELSSVEERYILNFQEPWFLNKRDVPLKMYLIREETESVDIDTRDVRYEIEKTSFIAGVEKELTERLKIGLNYEYSYVDTLNVKEGVILDREDTGTLGIGSLSPSLFYDRRDNPFDPTSGFFHSLVLKVASRAFLSETEFLKATFQSAFFYQLKEGIVYALSLRGGAAYEFEDTEELPLVERFFLGGRTTMRGYDRDSLGPKGADGEPTGGNIYALLNNEFRIALGKGFGLVTFLDMGNVWRKSDETTIKFKYSAGAGLRYRTPVGPVRIDYGHKLNRDEGESAGELHFSFGHAF